MRKLRPLARHVLETRSPETLASVEHTRNLAAWSCHGVTMHWHSKGQRLYHDAQPPHGHARTDEERALQALCGCRCEPLMARAKDLAIISARRNSLSDVQGFYGRGYRNAERRVGEYLSNVELLASNAEARWLDCIERAVGDRAKELATGDAVGAWKYEGAVRLRVGPNGDGMAIRPTWISGVLRSGLHEDLKNVLLLGAKVRGHAARCVALAFREHLYQERGSIYWKKDHHAFVLALECCRVDGRWIIQASSDLASIDLAAKALPVRANGRLGVDFI